MPARLPRLVTARPFLTVVWGVWLFGELLTPALVARRGSHAGRNLLGQPAGKPARNSGSQPPTAVEPR